MKRLLRTALLLSALSAFSFPAAATDTVSSPYVDKGKLGLEWRSGYTHDDDSASKDGAFKHKAVATYGATERIGFEVKANFERPGNSDDIDFRSIDLEAKYMITPRGAYWLDAGAKLIYGIGMDDDIDTLGGKLMLAKKAGSFSHRANLELKREVGDDADDEMQGGISWASRYAWKESVQPGFELYSDFGSLSDSGAFDDQSHRAGPVFYGKFSDAFQYEAGYLIGLSDAAADGTVKAILKYAIPVQKN